MLGRLLCGLGASILWITTAVAQVIVAVEDTDYVPYYTWNDGVLEGPCGEIVTAVLEEMGLEVIYRPAPWTRVIREVEEGDVDAALCATETIERLDFAIFPDEPLLSYDATLFVVEASDLRSSALSDLFGRSFGVVSGYSFGGAGRILEAAGMIRQEVTSRESLVRVLLAGRVDTVLDSRLPLMADVRRLEAHGEVRALEPSLSESPAYLMFSKTDEAAALAQRFSAALVAFKQTPAFAEIVQRYGMTP